MHKLLMKVTGMRLKVIFWPKCLYCCLWEINKYRHILQTIIDKVWELTYLEKCIISLQSYFPISIISRQISK